MFYHAAMRSLLRQGLIWTLVLAMTVAGLPLAHAQNCDTGRVVSAQHVHRDMPMDAGEDMAMDHAAMTDHASSPQHDDGPSATPCKCLNCSSLCAAFVAPLPHVVKIEQRVDTIVYVERAAVQRDAAVFIDPGIPIAA